MKARRICFAIAFQTAKSLKRKEKKLKRDTNAKTDSTMVLPEWKQVSGGLGVKFARNT